jgi:hypothetical protein
MSANLIAHGVRAWLSSPVGFQAVSQYVHHTLRHLQLHGSLAAAWPYPVLPGRTGQETPSITDDVTQDFLIFLLNQFLPKLPNFPVLSQNILNGNHGLFLDYGWRRFVWQLKEQARSKTINPMGYLYRRLREVLRASPVFLVRPNQAGLLYYARSETENGPLPLANPLREIAYGSWPIHSLHIPQDAAGELVYSEKWLTTLATDFLDIAAQHAGPVSWLPIRELVRYFGAMHPWLNRPMAVEQDPALSHLPLGHAASATNPVEVRVEQIDLQDGLPTLAQQLVLTWSEQECCILIWRLQDRPVPYREIALRLDLANHNRAVTLYRRVESSLRRFCASWPGPPLSELSMEIGCVFLDQIIRHARAICSRP